MIIAEVTFKNAAQMLVVDDDHVIQAFAPDTADHPLHVAILSGTPGCNPHVLDSHSLNSCREMLAVDSIAIANHIAWSAVFRERFNDLLCGPEGRGMVCDIEMEDAATVVRQDDQDIQHTQLNCRNCEEVDRYQLTQMIA